MIAPFLSALFISFFTGAIPTAYLAGKYLRGIDLRKEGSGNVGATNALRVMGKGIGYSVFIIDFLKGLLPALFMSRIYPAVGTLSATCWVGLAAILGHIFSPFLSFKGGKGIATGAGVTCAVNTPFFFVSIALWALIFLTTKTVSISSILAVLSLVILSFLFKFEWPTFPFFVLLFGIALWTHRENIRRLLRGEEKTFR